MLETCPVFNDEREVKWRNVEPPRVTNEPETCRFFTMVILKSVVFPFNFSFGHSKYKPTGLPGEFFSLDLFIDCVPTVLPCFWHR